MHHRTRRHQDQRDPSSLRVQDLDRQDCPRRHRRAHVCHLGSPRVRPSSLRAQLTSRAGTTKRRFSSSTTSSSPRRSAASSLSPRTGPRRPSRSPPTGHLPSRPPKPSLPQTKSSCLHFPPAPSRRSKSPLPRWSSPKAMPKVEIKICTNARLRDRQRPLYGPPSCTPAGHAFS